MDNISALEEMNDQVLTSDLKLFSGRPGIEWKMANYRGFMGTSNFLAANAPNGLMLDYFSKTAGPVRITVTDKAGNRFAQLNARAEAGVINRTSWDMRYDLAGASAGGRDGVALGGGGGGRGGARWRRTRRPWRWWWRGSRAAPPARSRGWAASRGEAGGDGAGQRVRRRVGGGGGGGGGGEAVAEAVAADAASAAGRGAHWSIPASTP